MDRKFGGYSWLVDAVPTIYGDVRTYSQTFGVVWLVIHVGVALSDTKLTGMLKSISNTIHQIEHLRRSWAQVQTAIAEPSIQPGAPKVRS